MKKRLKTRPARPDEHAVEAVPVAQLPRFMTSSTASAAAAA